MKKIVFVFALILGCITQGFSQEETTNVTDFKKWQVRLRGVGVVANEQSTIGVIGGKADITNTFIPELDITYFFTKNIAAELILGTTKHDVSTVNSDISAIGGPTQANINLGSVNLLPPTLTLQYHFYPGKDNVVKPYIGAGINYTLFYNEKPGNTVANVSYDNAFGIATQIGADFNLTDNFFLNIDAKYIFLKTDVTVDASNLAPNLQIPAKVTINPLLVGFGVGYRF